MSISGLIFLKHYIYLKIKYKIMPKQLDSKKPETLNCHVDNIEYPDNIITSTSTFIYDIKKEIENVEFLENEEGNFIEVTSIITNLMPYGYLNFGPAKRNMLKERYGIVDGKIQLVKSINGIEEPGYYVPPTVNWEE